MRTVLVWSGGIAFVVGVTTTVLGDPIGIVCASVGVACLIAAGFAHESRL